MDKDRNMQKKIPVRNLKCGMIIDYNGEVYKVLYDANEYINVTNKKFANIAVVVTFQKEPINMVEYKDFDLGITLVRE